MPWADVRCEWHPSVRDASPRDTLRQCHECNSGGEGDIARLEDLTPGASVRGIVPDALVAVESVNWFGSDSLELIYKTATGKIANQLLFRDDEPRIEIAEAGRPWGFDGDGSTFRLVSEALSP